MFHLFFNILILLLFCRLVRTRQLPGGNRVGAQYIINFVWIMKLLYMEFEGCWTCLCSVSMSIICLFIHSFIILFLSYVILWRHTCCVSQVILTSTHNKCFEFRFKKDRLLLIQLLFFYQKLYDILKRQKDKITQIVNFVKKNNQKIIYVYIYTIKKWQLSFQPQDWIFSSEAELFIVRCELPKHQINCSRSC